MWTRAPWYMIFFNRASSWHSIGLEETRGLSTMDWSPIWIRILIFLHRSIYKKYFETIFSYKHEKKKVSERQFLILNFFWFLSTEKQSWLLKSFNSPKKSDIKSCSLTKGLSCCLNISFFVFTDSENVVLRLGSIKTLCSFFFFSLVYSSKPLCIQCSLRKIFNPFRQE